MKHLLSITVIILLSSSITFAQSFCKGDHDYDGDCDSDDVASFIADFGRSQYNNPCPPDGPAPVPETSAGRGNGVPRPNPRYTDNGDGTVSDNLTGLIWLKDANCFGQRRWPDALDDCNGLASGSCGLTDGSNAREWRLANYKELISLIDVESYNPALPTGHPFNNVQYPYYWSSTPYASSSMVAWYVWMGSVYVSINDKASSNYIWCVRGGH